MNRFATKTNPEKGAVIDLQQVQAQARKKDRLFGPQQIQGQAQVSNKDQLIDSRQMQAQARKKDRLFGWQQAQAREKVRLCGLQKCLLKWARLDDGQAILDDTGLGAGLFLQVRERFHPARLCATYAQRQECQTALQLLPQLEAICSEQGEIPWHSQSFDVVLTTQAMFGAQAASKCTEAARVLRPQGQLLIAVPIYTGLLRARESAGCACSQQLCRLLEGRGFGDVSLRRGGLRYDVIIGYRAAHLPEEV